MLEFDWDEENLAHIARHRISADEAEYALQNPTVDFGPQDWHEEERFAEAGATRTGRILFIITTFRESKTRVVSAFDVPGYAVKAYYAER